MNGKLQHIFSSGLRLVRRHWPLALAMAAASNFIWEYLGYYTKVTLFGVSAVVLICNYLPRHIGGISAFFRHRLFLASGLSALGRFLPLITIIAILPFAFRTVMALDKLANSENRFRIRVDRMMDKSYKMYHSTYLPENIYFFLKQMLGKPYQPKLLDRSHRYDSLYVRVYHLGSCGMITYVFFGSGYEDWDTVYFVNQGEETLENIYRHIYVAMYPQGEELHPVLDPISKKGENVCCLGKILIPEKYIDGFGYLRSFWSPNSMGSDREGFSIDLQALVHPPRIVDVVLITNRDVDELEFSRLSRGHSLWDWLFCRPLYQSEFASEPESRYGPYSTQTNNSDFETMFLESKELYERVMKNIEDRQICALEKNEIQIYRSRFHCEAANNTFLIGYRVRKD